MCCRPGTNRRVYYKDVGDDIKDELWQRFAAACRRQAGVDPLPVSALCEVRPQTNAARRRVHQALARGYGQR